MWTRESHSNNKEHNVVVISSIKVCFVDIVQCKSLWSFQSLDSQKYSLCTQKQISIWIVVNSTRTLLACPKPWAVSSWGPGLRGLRGLGPPMHSGCCPWIGTQPSRDYWPLKLRRRGRRQRPSWLAIRRINLREAPPTVESELRANWPMASLSSRSMESSLNPDRKSLQGEEQAQ